MVDQVPLRSYLVSAVLALQPSLVTSKTAGPKATNSVASAGLANLAAVFDFHRHRELARNSFVQRVNFRQTCEAIMQASHADLVSAFLEGVVLMYGGAGKQPTDPPDLVAAHPALKLLCESFVKHYSTLMNLPVARAVAATFRLYRSSATAATAAASNTAASGATEEATATAGHSDSPKTQCTRLLQRAVGLSLNARGDPLGNKRRSVIPLASLLLRTYLRDGQFFLCEKLLRELQTTVDVKEDLKEYPLSDAVEFAYYIGKLAVVRERYQDAKARLTWAFEHCPTFEAVVASGDAAEIQPGAAGGKDYTPVAANLRRILRLLVPVKMVLGEVPSKNFLKAHTLLIYWPVCQAVKTGQIGKFRQVSLSQNGLFCVDVVCATFGRPECVPRLRFEM